MKQVLVEWFSSGGVWGVFLSILMNTLFSLAGFIPSIAVTGANVWVWGPLGGGLLSWVGESFGSVIAFVLYRTGFRMVTGKKTLPWKWINLFNSGSRTRQVRLLLLFRLIPFIPSGAVNVLGSMTTVRLRDFFWTTMIGKLPSTALEVSVSMNLIHIRDQYIYLIGTILLFLIGWMWWRKRVANP
ncbi:TVP38/TMEM64 family protein [Kroppenstedtia pulmonis]|uniref:TVP38/TMEM64 family membrane protein n=1 Tax=Kroppenstedtia pulmonis TaxID=1380685 RepID=A0A7D3YA86_9BACL|nr:VTT domain-containing protein [Kroppenstedtia pulmonis]QKG84801.1 TVP38/TMEM64 family protein [Kroppenstedtia pulmonis]